MSLDIFGITERVKYQLLMNNVMVSCVKTLFGKTKTVETEIEEKQLAIATVILSHNAIKFIQLRRIHRCMSQYEYLY